jgi:hypothetical protein
MMRAPRQMLMIAISARWSRAGDDNARSQPSAISHHGPDQQTFLKSPQANDAQTITVQTGSTLKAPHHSRAPRCVDVQSP